jgi:alpha-beta hydrolase superfamily lysophospholipase
MRKQDFSWRDPDGVEVYVYVCLPPENVPIKGTVQIVHGLGETALRYQRFAAELTNEGYLVFANDHRGHGRTAGHVDQIGIFDRDDFLKMYHDTLLLTDRIRDQYPEYPIYLFGHSMGSFLVQKIIYQSPYKVKGVILSGTNGKQGFMLHIGKWLAIVISLFKGETYRSTWLDYLTLGQLNNPFRPNRTAFDWLSRDEAEVDAYVANPNCGKVFTAAFYRDFFKLLIEIHQPHRMMSIPKKMPVLIISGDQDPVGNMGKNVLQLSQMYEDIGLKHVTLHLYPQARHELLNEINRDEVTRDILAWLKQRN